MIVVDSLRIALRAILSNRMRSSLTMLGIMIGVGSVILLLAVGNGASAAVSSQLEGLGTNVLTVFPRGAAGGPTGTGTDSDQVEITDVDVAAIRERGTESGTIDTVSPLLTVPNPTLTHRGASHQPSDFAAGPVSYVDALNFEVGEGRMFTEEEDRTRRRVIVIGPTVVDRLFEDDEEPVGQRIAVNGVRFEVIGILSSRGGSGPFSQDDSAIAPFGAAETNLTGAGSSLGAIIVQASSSEAAPEAERVIFTTLLETHGIDEPSEADFEVFNQATVVEVAGIATGIFTILLGAVAGISLLVGGIGVMNIMLVTVAERTREIGIRKAIGARRSHIIGQFLIEALLLSVLGGLLGVALGVGLSQIGFGSFQPQATLPAVLLAFGVSALVGLFFGLYPANRAASLRPIEALRYE